MEAQQAAGGRPARPAADARPRARDALQLARPGPRPAGACSTPSPARGALGFEAASRGAAEVVLLEREPALVAEPDGDRGSAWARAPCASAQPTRWPGWRARRGAFDLVLLDPPFDCRPVRAGAGRRGATASSPPGSSTSRRRRRSTRRRWSAASSCSAPARAGAVHSHLLRRPPACRRGYTAAASRPTARSRQRLARGDAMTSVTH